MFGFQVDKRISESILLQKWPRDTFDIEDDAYKTPIINYNIKLDVIILASSITRSDVEKGELPTTPRRYNDKFKGKLPTIPKRYNDKFKGELPTIPRRYNDKFKKKNDKFEGHHPSNYIVCNGFQ
jgi:hypothetical protein